MGDGMLVNYEYYRIFYYVAKYKNMTQAAAALMSSQPNVTRTIRQLERNLSCILFERTARGVELTEEGRILYSYVSAACEQIEAGEREITARLALDEGSVTIGASEKALHLFLFEKLKSFHSMYPGIRLKITNQTTPQAVRAISTGVVDFSVVTTPVDFASNVNMYELMSFQEIPVAGNQYVHLKNEKMSASDFAALPLICMDSDTSTYRFYRELFLKFGVEFIPDIEVATSDMVMPMVKNNLGVGFIPEVIAKEYVEEGSIFPIESEIEIPERQVCMITDKGRYMSAAADRLRKFLCE